MSVESELVMDLSYLSNILISVKKYMFLTSSEKYLHGPHVTQPKIGQIS
jgi:hypothetical protein